MTVAQDSANSAAHIALGKKLQAQIKSGEITTAQARDTLNRDSPALRQVADMKAKSQAAAAAAAPPPMNAAAFGANLRDKIKAGTMTNAQAQAAHNANVKAQMSPRAQAAAENANATLRAAKALQEYSGQQQQGASGGNLLGALRPGVTSPSMGGVKPGMTAPKSSMTPPKSSAPYMPAATAPSGPAPAGPPTTPGAAMRMKKGGKVSKPVKKMAKGGSTASSRGDGCAVRGKTKGTMR